MSDDCYTDLEATALIAETEREILNDALGIDSPEDAMPSDLIADQSQVEGWTGALSDSELIHTTAYGHDTPSFDRPLAWAEEQDAIRQNELLRAELTQRDQQILGLMQGPEVQEQLRKQQEDRRLELLGVACDDAQADQLLAHLNNTRDQIHAQSFARVDAALAAAHAKYGPDFEDTYRAITAMGKSPLAQQIVAQIWNAPDPGEAMMAHYGSDFIRGLGAGSGSPPPPFMPRSAAAPQGRRVEEDDLGFAFDHGGAGEEMERDIFRAATRR